MNFGWFASVRRKKSRCSRVDGLLTPAGSKSATSDNRQLQRDESRSTINDHYNYEERAATLSRLVNVLRGIIKQICADVSDLTSTGGRVGEFVRAFRSLVSREESRK